MGTETNAGETGYLSQNDSIMWTVEADPLLRSTIVGLIVLERIPDWDALKARMERVTHSVPILRQRVVNPPLHPRTQRWVWDTDFDLGYHLRRIRLPEPGTFDDLLAQAATIAEGGLDRARPLWEFTLVEGVNGVEGTSGETAVFVMKAHHVVTDGIGSVQLAAHLFDFEPDAEKSAMPPLPEASVEEEPSALNLWLDALGHDASMVAEMSRRGARGFLPTLLRAARDPRGAVADAAELAASVGRTVAPVRTRLSPVMTERQMARRFDVFAVPTAELKAAGKAAGGTLNDAFLAGITAAMRRYHEHHGTSVEELRMAMPISLRTEEHEAGGNHVTVMRFKVPVGTDPAQQMKDLDEVAARIRDEKSLPHTETIAGVLNLMPPAVLGSMLKRIDFLASNVPGLRTPMYLVGSRVTGYYPFGPTAGSSVNITLMSYVDTCYLGINTDTSAIPDPDVFMQCVQEGFDEVVAVGDR